MVPTVMQRFWMAEPMCVWRDREELKLTSGVTITSAITTVAVLKPHCVSITSLLISTLTSVLTKAF